MLRHAYDMMLIPLAHTMRALGAAVTDAHGIIYEKRLADMS